METLWHTRSLLRSFVFSFRLHNLRKGRETRFSSSFSRLLKSPRKKSTDARATRESEEPTSSRLRDHERDADDTESRARLSLVKHPLFGVRAWRWRIRWGSWLKVNRCQVVVLGRWFSLVCDPAYRPMRWLVSQGTPFGLSLSPGGGFSLVPSLIASSSCRRFTTLEKDLDRMYVCCFAIARDNSQRMRPSWRALASRRGIAWDTGVDWRGPQFSEHRDRRWIDRRRSSARSDGIQWSSITRIS